MSQFWLNTDGSLALNPDGSIVYDIEQALIDCCCLVPPTCPTDCCQCCYQYDVSIPAGTGTSTCVNEFGGSSKWTTSWSAQTMHFIWGSGCNWYAGAVPAEGLYVTRRFRSWWYDADCPDGITPDTDYTDNVWVGGGLSCVAGYWELTYGATGWQGEDWFTATKIASDCPDGNYTDGVSVVCNDADHLACCTVDCSVCPATYALVVSGFTGTCAFFNGTRTLTRDGCNWRSDDTYFSIGCDSGNNNHWTLGLVGGFWVDVDIGPGVCPPTGSFSTPSSGICDPVTVSITLS